MGGPNYREIRVRHPVTGEQIKIKLHVYLWLSFQGLWKKGQTTTPEGYELHHKDFDPFNNEIENLQLVTCSEHKEIHWQLDRERKIERFKERMASLTPETVEAAQKKKSESLKKYWATVKPEERKRRADVARAAHRKLSDDDVREIRKLYQKGARGKVAEICERFNISRQHIRYIVSGKYFSDIV